MDERRDEEHESEGFPGIDGLIGTFFREPSLWPVLVVILASGGVFGAALVVLTVVDRNPFAGLALLLVGGMSVDAFLRGRRGGGPRSIARLVGALWVSALLFTGLAIWSGIAVGR